jgi:hypothetical protein
MVRHIADLIMNSEIFKRRSKNRSRYSTTVWLKMARCGRKRPPLVFASVLDIEPVFILSVATFPLDKIRVFFEDSLSCGRVFTACTQFPGTRDGMNRTAHYLAPAKINLCLHVLGRRPDGYHELAMIMQRVSLFDRLQLTLTDEPGVRVVCPGVELPPDGENIAAQAARRLLDLWPGTAVASRLSSTSRSRSPRASAAALPTPQRC